MEQLKFLNVKEPLSEADLQRLESLIGCRLPEDYRRFLIAHNGGRPEPGHFRVRWSGQDWSRGWELDSVHSLFSVYEGFLRDRSPSVAEVFKSSRRRIPPELIPIGCDPGSNSILLSIAGDRRGAVWFAVKDFAPDIEEGEAPDYRNIGFVADSFQQFLDGLFDGEAEVRRLRDRR